MITIESMGMRFTCDPESLEQSVAHYHANGREPEGVSLEGVEIDVERYDSNASVIGKYRFTDGQFHRID